VARHPVRISVNREPALDLVSYGRRGPGRPERFAPEQVAQIARTVPSHEHQRRGAAVSCDACAVSGHRHQRGGRRNKVLRRQIYRACLKTSTTSCSHGTRCSMSKVPASRSLIMRL
jgi:hypothetical protein